MHIIFNVLTFQEYVIHSTTRLFCYPAATARKPNDRIFMRDETLDQEELIEFGSHPRLSQDPGIF